MLRHWSAKFEFFFNISWDSFWVNKGGCRLTIWTRLIGKLWSNNWPRWFMEKNARRKNKLYLQRKLVKTKISRVTGILTVAWPTRHGHVLQAFIACLRSCAGKQVNIFGRQYDSRPLHRRFRVKLVVIKVLMRPGHLSPRKSVTLFLQSGTSVCADVLLSISGSAEQSWVAYVHSSIQ